MELDFVELQKWKKKKCTFFDILEPDILLYSPVLFHYTGQRQAKYLILCSMEEKKTHAGLNDMILNNWTFCHHLLTNDEKKVQLFDMNKHDYIILFSECLSLPHSCLFLLFSLRIRETGSSCVTFSVEVTANRHVTVINTSVMHFPRFSFFEGSLFLFPSAEISSSLRQNTNNEAFNL